MLLMLHDEFIEWFEYACEYLLSVELAPSIMTHY